MYYKDHFIDIIEICHNFEILDIFEETSVAV